MNFKFQPPAMFVFLVFLKSGLIKSCFSIEISAQSSYIPTQIFMLSSVSPDKCEGSMKMAVFWHVAPCSLVEVDRRFRGDYCDCPNDRGSKYLWNLGQFHKFTRRNVPESSDLQTHRRENLKSHADIVSKIRPLPFPCVCFHFIIHLTQNTTLAMSVVWATDSVVKQITTK
jgi:hypothetical protein